MGVLDIVQDSGVLANASHADTVGIVAPQVLHEDVGCVWLGSEAIISNVDTGVQDVETIEVVRVESIGVLWLGLYSHRQYGSHYRRKLGNPPKHWSRRR